MTLETTPEDAKGRGAVALFGEKYGDTVRLVEIEGFSAELCGGTHVASSGEVGGFKIVSEASIGSGIRRIEAITGTNLLPRLRREEIILDRLAERFKANYDTLLDKVSAFLESMIEAKKELEAKKQERAGDTVEELLAKALQKGAVRLVTGVFEDLDVEGLRALSDGLKAASKGLVNVLVSKFEGKVAIIASVTDDLLDKGLHAGKLVKELAAAGGGGGGGKADMAQAGVKDPSKIPEILAAAEQYIDKIDNNNDDKTD